MVSSNFSRQLVEGLESYADLLETVNKQNDEIAVLKKALESSFTEESMYATQGQLDEALEQLKVATADKDALVNERTIREAYVRDMEQRTRTLQKRLNAADKLVVTKWSECATGTFDTIVQRYIDELVQRLTVSEDECLRLQSDLGHGRDERIALRNKLDITNASLKEAMELGKRLGYLWSSTLVGKEWYERTKGMVYEYSTNAAGNES